MKTQTDIQVGRVALTPMTVPRLQTAGGRRPPGDRRSRRWMLAANRRGRRTFRYLSGVFAGLAIGASLTSAQAASTPMPDLSGNYRCEGSARSCVSGTTFTMTQSGTDLQIKNDKGDTGTAKLTSNITLSAGPIWNMFGVITTPDNRTIQWSNGTSWRKQ